MRLTEVERGIIKTVVHRFLNLKKSTPRRPLVTQFKAPEALDRLVKYAILRTNDNNQTFLPMALAFHYCGDADGLRLAKRSAEVVVHVLQNLFEIQPDKTDFTPSDVEAHARTMYDSIEPETIRLGLYLVQEFGVLAQWSGNPQDIEISFLRISERIITLRNIDRIWDDHVRNYSTYLEQQQERRLEPTAEVFTREERVRLSFLVFDSIPKPQPHVLGGETGGEGLWKLHELLQRALGRRDIGEGYGVAQHIQRFIDTAPEEELLTMIELMPRAKKCADHAQHSPFRHDTRSLQDLMEAANQFLDRVGCPARFGPDGRFHRTGFAVRTLPELAGLPDTKQLLRDIATNTARRVPVSVIFVDLDDFKSVNDTLGHDGGDKCLASAVRIIGPVILERGKLYRLGGDEFGVILPNFVLAEASATAERIRSGIDQSNPGGSVKVTASIGVAEALGVEDADTLLAAADEAMYVSKHTGGNRVTNFPPSPELKAEADCNRHKATPR